MTNPHIPTRDGTAISSVSKWVAEVNQHHTTSARAKHLLTPEERVYGFASSTDGGRTKSSRAEPVVSLGGGSFESLVSSGVASPSASVRGSPEFVQEEEDEEHAGHLVAAPSSTALDTILSFASFHFDDDEEEDVLLREEDGAYANMINERVRTASSSSSNVLKKGKSTAPSSVQSFDCAGEEEVLTSSGSKTVSPPVHGGQSQSQSKRHGVVWTIGSSSSSSKKMEEPIQRLAVAPVSQIQHKSKFTIGPSRSYASPFGEDSNDDDDDYSDEGSDEYYSDEEDMDEEDEAGDDDLSTSQPPLRSLEDLLASSASSSHPSASEWTRRGRTGRSDEHQYGYDMYGYDGYGYQWEAGNGTPTVTTARASS